jgi:Spy/CpxP family protein refolding chaperone
MGFVLHELNLTPEQKTQLKTAFADEESQFRTLRASMKANRQALATTPPTDSSYATLIETAKSNAATRISLESQLWTNIYQNVLSKPQREAIPGIVAAAQQQREAKMEAWKARHPQAN